MGIEAGPCDKLTNGGVGTNVKVRVGVEVFVEVKEAVKV